VTVYLVGAGPGDPGLLTVRGAEVLARADVVIYDRLSVASLLELAPPDAERISVGKAPGGEGVSQDDINALLIERGRAGGTVVRLKGGDPFVFARGGEEAAALLGAGVPFEVVPGVTSAVAVPAYAGVPLTQRGLATSFTVVTGHEDPWAATETDWDAVARVGGTIVILMGVATRAEIARRLVAAGLDGATPAVAVQWGTRPEQITVRTTLAGLGDAAVAAPATIVIGAVAGLDLAWFEHRPLFGRRVVVTRPAGQASGLSRRLRSVGAEVLEVPSIEITEAADGGAAMLAASASAARYDWVVFTSANAVGRFLSLLPDARDLGPAKVAAVGSATAEELANWRVVADLVPQEFVAEALLAAFPDGPGRILLPQAAGARDVLSSGLRDKGWDVDVVEAYRTEPVPIPPSLAEAARQADAIAFTSSSAVTSYLEAAGRDAIPPVVACIGPVTAATARRLGLDVTAEAVTHDLDGLVAALIRALAPSAERGDPGK
jgi:uroporphyrinogen III methyltransferase/synthase